MKAKHLIKNRTAGVVALVFAAMLAGCAAGIDEVAYQGPVGVTGTPIKAFANLKPGSEEDFILNIGRRTYFKAGSSALDGTAKATLDKQAVWLNQYPRWKIKLQGHADDPGGNGKVSTQRAETVMNYLVSKGVSADRMWAKGYARKRQVRNCADVS